MAENERGYVSPNGRAVIGFLRVSLLTIISFDCAPAFCSVLSKGTDFDTGLLKKLKSPHWDGDALLSEIAHSGPTEVNFVNGKGESALTVAIHQRKWDAMRALVSHPAVHLHRSNRDGRTVLHYAIEECCYEAVDALLATSADLNGTMANGVAPIHLAAAAAGKGDSVAVAGGDGGVGTMTVVATNGGGGCGIDGSNGRVSMPAGTAILLRLLSTVPVPVLEARDNDGNTPLHYLLRNDHCDESLLEALLARLERQRIAGGGSALIPPMVMWENQRGERPLSMIDNLAGQLPYLRLVERYTKARAVAGASTPSAANNVVATATAATTTAAPIPSYSVSPLSITSPSPPFALQVCSDLHLEFFEGRPFEEVRATIVPSAPFLALLGDVSLPNVERGLALYRQLLASVAPLFRAVFVVLGNHEFYFGSLETTATTVAALCRQFPNVYLLNNGRVDVGDVAVLGTTCGATYRRRVRVWWGFASTTTTKYERGMGTR